MNAPWMRATQMRPSASKPAVRGSTMTARSKRNRQCLRSKPLATSRRGRMGRAQPSGHSARGFNSCCSRGRILHCLAEAEQVKRIARVLQAGVCSLSVAMVAWLLNCSPNPSPALTVVVVANRPCPSPLRASQEFPPRRCVAARAAHLQRKLALGVPLRIRTHSPIQLSCVSVSSGHGGARRPPPPCAPGTQKRR